MNWRNGEKGFDFISIVGGDTDVFMPYSEIDSGGFRCGCHYASRAPQHQPNYTRMVENTDCADRES